MSRTGRNRRRSRRNLNDDVVFQSDRSGAGRLRIGVARCCNGDVCWGRQNIRRCVETRNRSTTPRLLLRMSFEISRSSPNRNERDSIWHCDSRSQFKSHSTLLETPIRETGLQLARSHLRRATAGDETRNYLTLRPPSLNNGACQSPRRYAGSRVIRRKVVTFFSISFRVKSI